MPIQTARVSVSSWSLRKTLGDPAFYGVQEGHNIPVDSHNKGDLSLLELPQALADFGIHTLEIPHFHFPSLDDVYLSELKQSLASAKVELFSVLVDDGDITHPTDAKTHVAWMAAWLDVAAKLGSRCARVIAGKQAPTEEAISTSSEHLMALATQANALGVRLMTENWFETASTPEIVTQLINVSDGQLGLCLDFGNWKGDAKYEQFKQIAHFAESCHAKAYFDNGVLKAKDYEACLEITKDVGFKGPYTLVFEDAGISEWEGLKQEMALVQPYLA